MTKFEARLTFGADSSAEDAEKWAEAFRMGLPEGAEAEVKAIPLVLSVEDVMEEHAGNRVTIRGYYKPVKDRSSAALKAHAPGILNTTNLTGTLDHVFPTGGHQGRRTFIIDGAAYDIPAYSLIELGDW